MWRGFGGLPNGLGFEVGGRLVDFRVMRGFWVAETVAAARADGFQGGWNGGGSGCSGGLGWGKRWLSGVGTGSGW